jgi:hypothetical protein
VQITPDIKFKSRIEFTHVDKTLRPDEDGAAFAQDIIFKKMKFPLTFTVRYAVFDTSQIVISTAFEQLRAARATVDYTSANYNGSSIDATTFIQNIQNYWKAAKSYKAAVNRYNVSVASLYRYSALWPGLSYSGIERRIPRLKRQ